MAPMFLVMDQDVIWVQMNSWTVGLLGPGKMIQLNGQRLQLQKDLFDDGPHPSEH